MLPSGSGVDRITAVVDRPITRIGALAFSNQASSAGR
jgi:hypothetical protein